MAKDKLKLIEQELQFIRNHVNNLQTTDFEELDEINMAIESALRALFEHRLDVQPASEEIPAGVAYPHAA